MPTIVAFIIWLLAITAHCSEFPERECCDLTTPEATLVTTTPVSIKHATPAGLYISGTITKSSVAILNCLLARQICLEDASCSAILQIIPRVCGLEVVACSTVTVTKCQAALRTLQAFPFFKPTCLCREPHFDPNCNSFRDFLFDHPCMFVKKKEKDPYPIDALPTCTHAYFVCQQETKCIKLYEEFKTHCKVRDNRCRLENKDLCFESWVNLRKSPMFGCFCPINHMKKRCDRIFSMVNHNPCIAANESSNPFHDEIGNNLFKNPLVDLVNGFDAHAKIDQITLEVLGNRAHSTDLYVRQYPEEEEEKLLNSTQHARLLGTLDEEERKKDIFKSTCHLAINNCSNNYHCRRMLSPILLHCDNSNCNRNSCMEALDAFFTKADFQWNNDIAFCLCEKTDKKDSCLIAQEKVYPMCVQKSKESVYSNCISIANNCKENSECRLRLEFYEQSCAVDSVTKKCAGSLLECRKAILNILGTELRTFCGCKGIEPEEVYQCLAWQRLLWVNPCVVDVQKHFHRSKAAELKPQSLNTIAATSTTSTSTTTTQPNYTVIKVPTSVFVTAESVPIPHAFAPTSTTSNPSTSTKVVATTTNFSSSTKTIKELIAVTTAKIFQPKSCVVQRPKFPDQFIIEGTYKRIHHEDEFECSDLCECQLGEKLACRTICIDRMPCKTEFAFYNHAAPAYQAFRGRCLCYSGRFICMKPFLPDFGLSHGVYLFLGYSETDQRELNKNQTKDLVVIQDVVKVLQTNINAINNTLCRLKYFNSTKENIIILGKLDEKFDVTKMSPAEILAKEKEECVDLLEIVSDQINSKHPDFMSHVLLSVIKIAEVEIVPVEMASTVASFKRNISYLWFFIIIKYFC